MTPPESSESQDDTPNVKRRGLGRGLNALFGDDEVDMDTPVSISEMSAEQQSKKEESGAAGNSNRRLISIGQIIPCPYQPRQTFNDATLDELAHSIRQHGLIQPILVRPHPENEGSYEIVAGERRWRAAQKAQLHEVPVIIRELDDTTTLEIALIENLQREDLNALDEAQALRQLASQFDYTHEQVAQKVGKSRSYVANMLRLMDLTPDIQELVRRNMLSAGHARALLPLTPIQQEEHAKKILEGELSVRQTEYMVSQFLGRDIKAKSRTTKSGKKTSVGEQDKDVSTQALEKEVSNILGMQVSIDMVSQQEGTMSIRFKSLDQLDEVLHRLSHNPGRLAIKG